MARRETIIKNVFTDDVHNAEHLGELSADQWLRGVNETLEYLYTWQPCATGQAVLDGISATGKTVTIVPSKTRALGPDKEFGNAYAEAVDERKATAPGKPTEHDNALQGIGGGSDCILQFVAQDWDGVDHPPISFKAVDEVLLHELVHALRQGLGQEDNTNLPPATPAMGLGADLSTNDLMLGKGPPPTRVTQIYETIEEFVAIVITNVYRSENRRHGLVRDHLGPRARRGEPAGTDEKPFRDPKETTRELGYPLTNPRHFLTLWRPQLKRLQLELATNGTIAKIANVQCNFNPFWEMTLESLRPQSSWAH